MHMVLAKRRGENSRSAPHRTGRLPVQHQSADVSAESAVGDAVLTGPSRSRGCTWCWHNGVARAAGQHRTEPSACRHTRVDYTCIAAPRGQLDTSTRQLYF